MRTATGALALVMLAATLGTAMADDMKAASPKPAAMHSTAMKGHDSMKAHNSMKGHDSMKADHMGGHMMGSPKPKPSANP